MKPTLKIQDEPVRPQRFAKPFQCVGVARTAIGFVVVVTSFDAQGRLIETKTGRAQQFKEFIAGEAKHALLAEALSQ